MRAVPKRMELEKLARELSKYINDRQACLAVAKLIRAQPDPNSSKAVILTALAKLESEPKAVRDAVSLSLRNETIARALLRDPALTLRVRIDAAVSAGMDPLIKELETVCPDSDACRALAKAILYHPSPASAKKGVMGTLKALADERKKSPETENEITMLLGALRYENIASAFTRSPSTVSRTIREFAESGNPDFFLVIYALNSPAFADALKYSPYDLSRLIRRFAESAALFLSQKTFKFKDLITAPGFAQIILRDLRGNARKLIECSFSKNLDPRQVFDIFSDPNVLAAFSQDPSNFTSALVRLISGMPRNESILTALPLLKRPGMSKAFLDAPQKTVDNLIAIANLAPALPLLEGEDHLLATLGSAPILQRFLNAPASLIARLSRLADMSDNRHAEFWVPPAIVVEFCRALQNEPLATAFLADPAIASRFLAAVFRAGGVDGTEAMRESLRALRIPRLAALLASDEKRFVSSLTLLMAKSPPEAMILLQNERLAAAFEKDPKGFSDSIGRLHGCIAPYAYRKTEIGFMTLASNQFRNANRSSEAREQNEVDVAEFFWLLSSGPLADKLSSDPGWVLARLNEISQSEFRGKAINFLSTLHDFREFLIAKPAAFMAYIRSDAFKKDDAMAVIVRSRELLRS